MNKHVDNRKKQVRRQLRIVGDIVLVALPNGIHAYARVLQDPLVAFYDKEFRESASMDEIVRLPVAFKLLVMNHAIRNGRWRRVGNLPLEPALTRTPKFFKFDSLSGALMEYQMGGLERAVRAQDVDNLESAAVWYPEQVERRLLDHFAGRPNETVVFLREKAGLTPQPRQ